jgi:hypothetical protein
MMYVNIQQITAAIDATTQAMRTLNPDMFTGFVRCILHELAANSKSSGPQVHFNLTQLAADIDIFFPITINTSEDNDDTRYIAQGSCFDWDSLCLAMQDDLHEVVQGIALLASNDLEVTCNLKDVVQQVNADLRTLNWLIEVYHNELIETDWFKAYKH